MEETNFDRLLHRYLHNQLSTQEKAKFTAWLNVLQRENNTDLELSKVDQEKLFQKITSNTESVDDVIALYPKRPWLRQTFSKQWVQIAASVVIILSVSFTIWSGVTDSNPLQMLTSNGIEKTILNDGTIVWLQKGSKFIYYEKDGERHATLTGEALFEVAKIPNSAFTIVCGGINVRVLGTSFSLKTGQERIELNVLTGKVNLTSANDDVGVNVEPKEKVVYTTKGEIERIALTEPDVSALTENTEYDMNFRKDSMEKIIECIARKFDVTITIKDKSLNKCRISADFTDKSLENTLAILTDLLDVTYIIKGDHVELSGKGC